MQFLYGYPDWAIILGIALAVAALTLGVMNLLNRFLPPSDKDTMDLVMRVMTSTSAILTFVLAFSIVQAKSDLNKVQEAINVEARALGAIDRLLLRLDTEASAPAREALARYAVSVVNDEWPMLRRQSRSVETGTRIRRFSSLVDVMQPSPGRQQTLFTEVVRGAETLEQRRDERLFHAEHTRLPLAFWLIIGILFTAISVMGAFFRLRFVSLLLIAGQGAMFGVLAAFLFVLDEPFLSRSGVSPEPFKRAVATLSGRSALGADELRRIGVTPRAMVESK